MSKKPTLTGETLKYVTIAPSGAVTVDLEGFLRSAAGQEQLKGLRRVAEHVRRAERAAAEASREPVSTDR